MNSIRRPKGEVFTTTEVAAVCRVAPRTAAGWIDGDQLKGYRVPGTTHRRVLRTQLAEFMAANWMPAEWLTDWVAARSKPTGGEAVATDPSTRVVRLDTPPEVAADVAGALATADFADCVVLFKLTPAKDKVSMHVTRDGETVAKLGLVMPEGAGAVLRELVRRAVNEAVDLSAGGVRYAV